MTVISLTYRINRSGLRMLLCGVPARSFTTWDRVLPSLTWMVLSMRNDEISLSLSLGRSML